MCFSIISGSMATAAKTEVLLLLLYRILYSMYNNDRRASRRSSWWRLHYGEPWGCTASRTTRSASPPSPTGTVLLFVLFLALSRWGRLRPADKFQSQLQEKEPLKLGLPLRELKTSSKHNTIVCYNYIMCAAPLVERASAVEYINIYIYIYIHIHICNNNDNNNNNNNNNQ